MLILGRGKTHYTSLCAYFCLIKRKLISGNSHFKAYLHHCQLHRQKLSLRRLKMKILITSHLRVLGTIMAQQSQCYNKPQYAQNLSDKKANEDRTSQNVSEMTSLSQNCSRLCWFNIYMHFVLSNGIGT